METEEYKYVKLSEDRALYDLCMQPIIIEAGEERTIIPKPFLVCDLCNKRVLSTKEEIEECKKTNQEYEKDVGYAELSPDGKYITNVFCKECMDKVKGE